MPTTRKRWERERASLFFSFFQTLALPLRLSDDEEEEDASSSTDSESGVVAWSPAAEAEVAEAETLAPGKMEWWEEAPASPPKEPSDPEAIRKYCGRTSVSGRESSSRSYASSTIKKKRNNNKTGISFQSFTQRRSGPRTYLRTGIYISQSA